MSPDRTHHMTTEQYRREFNLRMTEATLQKKCEIALRELGCLAYHTYDSRKSSPGFPDLITITPKGRLGAFELKTERGKVTGHQQKWLDRLGLVPGVTVAVIRPSDYDWLISWAMGEGG